MSQQSTDEIVDRYIKQCCEPYGFDPQYKTDWDLTAVQPCSGLKGRFAFYEGEGVGDSTICFQLTLHFCLKMVI